MIRIHEVQEAVDQLEVLPHEVKKEFEDWLQAVLAKAEASLAQAHTDLADLNYCAYTLAEEIGDGIAGLKKIVSQAGVDSPDAKFETYLADVERDLKMISRVYPGEKAFRLYDTFGMPLDFIQDAARDRGIAF